MKIILSILLIVGGLMASSLPKHYESTLKNGMKVVVIPMRNGTEVISVDIFYRVGSRNEVMGKSGIAHMLEHLNFKSTKHLKAGEFDEIVKSFGGVDNASTGFDYTHYFIKCSSKNLDKSLWLFAELMANLKLDEKEFATEREVVAEERRWRTDNNPMGYLYFRLFNNTFIYHPYHWTPIGFMQDILHWKIEDIRSFHRTYYQPKNAILVVAGDIDKEKVFELAKKHFEKIPNCCDIPKVHQIEPPQDGAKRIVLNRDSQVEMLAIAFHTPNFKSPDQVALNAISELLSSGKSSRLYQKLVDEKKMVNQIYAYNFETIDPGLFLFMATANPGITAEEIEKEIWSEIEKLKEGKIDQKELEKIKINTKADFIFSLENSSTLASVFGDYYAKGDIDPLLHYEENIDKLQIKDVVDVAKKYFTKKNSTTVILRKGQ